MSTAPLFLAVAVLSVAYMVFQRFEWPRAALWTKPLPIVLLALGAWVGEPRDPTYRLLMVAGLGCCAVGDVCLALPRERFLAGLVSFLLGHLAYLTAFVLGLSAGDLARALPFAVLFATLGGAIYASLHARLGKLAIPCGVYVLVLCAMATAGAVRSLSLGSPLPLLGGSLFFASDAVLAIDRFRSPFRAARIIVYSTYVAAQAFIAASVWR